jgi:hypothetical protein
MNEDGLAMEWHGMEWNGKNAQDKWLQITVI